MQLTGYADVREWTTKETTCDDRLDPNTRTSEPAAHPDKLRAESYSYDRADNRTD